jgi:hypothetical protein|tara:strand:- start:186 stop:398 length:213 start_codon:yes stop_codon:yes gene_type:complete
MQNKTISSNDAKKIKLENMIYSESPSKSKVDVNVLLNRVKFEKKSEIKKNLILTAGVVGALSVTAFITII